MMESIHYFSNNDTKKFFLRKYVYFTFLSYYRNLKIKNFKRTKSFVNLSYDQGGWKRVIENKFWEKSSSLKSLLYGHYQTAENENKQIYAIYDHKLCKLPVSILHEQQIKQRINIFKEFLPQNGEIIELGCGFGYNLFALRLHDFKNNLSGFDISENSIKVADIINEKFSLGIKFDNVDLATKLQSLDLTGKTIFTSHVFEQLTHLTRNVLMNILETKPLQVLHFEPIYEFYKNNLRDKTCKKYIEYKDYQKTLYSELKNMENEGLIKITHDYRLGIAENPLNEPSLIRWVPK